MISISRHLSLHGGKGRNGEVFSEIGSLAHIGKIGFENSITQYNTLKIEIALCNEESQGCVKTGLGQVRSDKEGGIHIQHTFSIPCLLAYYFHCKNCYYCIKRHLSANNAYKVTERLEI